MVQRIEALGLKAHVIVGTERTVIAAVGDDRKAHKESLESGPGVAEVDAHPGPLQGGQPGGQTRADDGPRRQPHAWATARSA